MGSWGIKTFENDDASDWLCDLEDVSDMSAIESALNEADSQYIEAPEGCNILAAAEIIMALTGKGRKNLPENASYWVSKHTTSLDASPLKEQALKAVEAVLSEKSELNELWRETECYELWQSDVKGIMDALM